MSNEELAGRLRQWFDTGVKDMHGNPVHEGDRVRYNLEGSHTKREYWNPEYEVVFDPPKFGLKHVGGGLDDGTHDFILRCGGGNGMLEIIQKGNAAALTEAGAGETEPVAFIQKAHLDDFDVNGCEIVDTMLFPKGTLRPENQVALYASPPPVQPEVKALRETLEWVNTWVSNPVSSYSVHALDGLFAITRERIHAALTTPPSPAPGVTDGEKLAAAHSDAALLAYQAGAATAYWDNLAAALQPAEQPDEGDSEETIDRNPKSWIAWKREATRLRAERDEAIEDIRRLNAQHKKQSEHDGKLLDRLRQRVKALEADRLVDLRRLMTALGMNTDARSQSPASVFDECLMMIEGMRP